MPVQRSSSDRVKGFFFPLVRKSFDQLGVGDQQVAEYVATVLNDFSRSDRLLQLRDAEGRRLTSVVEMALAQLGPDEEARVLGERAVRKYVGDYTLFMSGLFRRFVERGGYLAHYPAVGPRSDQAAPPPDRLLLNP